MTKHTIIHLLLACVLLAACSDNDTTATDQSKAFPVVIVGQAFGYETDASGSSWNKGETIGVTLLKAGTCDIVAPYSNLRYYANSRTDQDYFLPGSNDSIPYLPATGEAMDIAAYYPQATALADSLVSLHLIRGYGYASNLLFSRITNLNKDNRKAVLQLRPALTKLTFKFKVGKGMTEANMKGLTVTLKGLPVSGHFNTLTGKVSFREVSTQQDIRLVTVEKKPTSRALSDDADVFITAQGMVLPASTTAGYQVVVELPAINQRYNYEIPKGTDQFEGSQEYTFDSTINNDDMIVSVQSSPIINWGQGGIIGGEGEEEKKK